MLPIPGTSVVAHAEQNCAAAAVALSEAQFDELDKERAGPCAGRRDDRQPAPGHPQRSDEK